jgi:hypothetical protein
MSRQTNSNSEDKTPSYGGSISPMPISSAGSAKTYIQPPAMPDSVEELDLWTFQKYFDIGFDENTCIFIGWEKFLHKLLAQEPDEAKHARIIRGMHL